MRFNLNPEPEPSAELQENTLLQSLLELIADGRVTVSRNDDGELIYKSAEAEEESDSQGGFYFNNWVALSTAGPYTSCMMSITPMNHTIRIDIEQLVRNFADSHIGFILEEEGEDRDDRRDEFVRTLGNLLSSKASTQIGTLRHSFQSGYTIMLLGSSDFHLLEQWNEDGLDFCIVVTNGDSTLCILAKPEINW